jgi:hypothetical protein
VVKLDVWADFGGDIPSALGRAAAIGKNSTDAHPIFVDVELGAHEYRLNTTLQIPSRSTLVGAGAGQTVLSFLLTNPGVRGDSAGSSIIIGAGGDSVGLHNFSFVIDARSNRSDLIAIDDGSRYCTLFHDTLMHCSLIPCMTLTTAPGGGCQYLASILTCDSRMLGQQSEPKVLA